RIAEIKEYTIFLVGGKPEIVERAYFNIRRSFPSIRIVGRHGGFFSVAREEAIIEAIKKSDPDLIFVGLGFPKEEKWINRVRNEFKNAVVVGVGGSLDVVSGEIKKAPDFIMERGLDWFYRIITRPWRIGRLILVFIFYIRVFFAWLFSKR
ncbi:MAG: WecB/TagA/CpsF family glycosyltransferase, partial [Spirochaetota bacterium]|nr:WecB/TagA/CpsF family glycosyltransferase [Spirochaetota bacterium]